MNNDEFKTLIDRLRSEPDETPWLEFKVNHYEPQTLGEYLSALSNSACIHSKDRGYLIFGIEDRTHRVIGTKFKLFKKKVQNQDLQLWLTQGLDPNIGYTVECFPYEDKNVVLFQIHAAFDRPVKFYNRAYIRIGEHKTRLSKHPELERAIWNKHRDWSAQIPKDATIDDLSKEAIKKARVEYKTKYPEKTKDVNNWNDKKFLDKVKLTIHGKITNAALLLLGKPESEPLISPAVARISWFLKDAKMKDKDYEHFGPPFLLTVDNVFSKIRNLTYRHMPSGTLFPIEISQYDRWVIREALHNCIAHQDYILRGRINLVETPNTLLFSNKGSFLPGNVEEVIKKDIPPEIYRNQFLAAAMVNLNMIDTQGGGIKKMYEAQKERYFPLPDYDLNNPETVIVKIQGEILDEKYTRLLMERADLDLWTVILLDKIQKRIKISREDYKYLKKIKAVQGRYPHIFVSSKIAAATGEKARHIKNLGLDRSYYIELIMTLLREHKSASRSDIDELLLNKLPDVLNEKQKKTKIHNILYALSKEGKIENSGSRRSPKWIKKITNKISNKT